MDYEEVILNEETLNNISALQKILEEDDVIPQAIKLLHHNIYKKKT